MECQLLSTRYHSFTIAVIATFSFHSNQLSLHAIIHKQQKFLHSFKIPQSHLFYLFNILISSTIKKLPQFPFIYEHQLQLSAKWNEEETRVEKMLKIKCAIGHINYVVYKVTICTDFSCLPLLLRLPLLSTAKPQKKVEQKIFFPLETFFCVGLLLAFFLLFVDTYTKKQ